MLIPNFFEMVSRNCSSKSYKQIVQIRWPKVLNSIFLKQTLRRSLQTSSFIETPQKRKELPMRIQYNLSPNHVVLILFRIQTHRFNTCTRIVHTKLKTGSEHNTYITLPSIATSGERMAELQVIKRYWTKSSG